MISTYYQYIINIIIDKYSNEFEAAMPGHCMKITGLAKEQLQILLQKVRTQFRDLNTYILSDKDFGPEYISATKLIELRNEEKSALLILIPSNSRTAAEDSYGNATFKDVNLTGIEDLLLEKLKANIPDDFKTFIQEVINYSSSYNLKTNQIIQFLLSLEQSPYSKEQIGNNLHFLGMIPDESLLLEFSKIRARLNFNINSVAILSDFGKSIYERVKQLPIEKKSIQTDLVSFLKDSELIKNAKELVNSIAQTAPALNFKNWPIPDLNQIDFKLWVENIRSPELVIQDGNNYITSTPNKSVKVKIRICTLPKPKDVAELKHFRLSLYAVNGTAGEFVHDLRKCKNSSTNKSYRDLTVELNPTIIEEGNYFIKVQAEDENGILLNVDDDFKSEDIQQEWLFLKKTEENPDKKSLDYKLASDSDDFHFSISDIVENDDSIRKDKLNNVTQAYYKWRISQLRNAESLTIPLPESNSATWLDNKLKKTNLTFHIQYSSKHNYQINLSGKLVGLEHLILYHGNTLGYVKGVLDASSSKIDLNSVDYIEASINDLASEDLKITRAELFNLILASAPNNTGVFETTSSIDLINAVKNYLNSFNSFLEHLNTRFAEISPENVQEKSEVQDLLTELQYLDIIQIKTKLPDGKILNFQMLSPLHPLRLAWFLNLLDLFEDWESKTLLNDGYKKDWFKNLESFFLGDLMPDNNLPVIVEPVTLKNFQYAGEIVYGWGIYLTPSAVSETETLTSLNRQIKAYVALLFNIEKTNRLDDEISQKLIERHFLNYIRQHPYTDKLVVNLFNAGDAITFANALVELEKNPAFNNLKYEIRLFKGKEIIIDQGEGLKNLLNPEYTVSEEAEAFSRPSENRLFPKLRFSVNSIKKYLESPGNYNAHLSFLISPFSTKIELIKPVTERNSFYLNGLITESITEVKETGSEIRWDNYVSYGEKITPTNEIASLSINIFKHLQKFVASALAGRTSDSLPSIALVLGEVDKVLINNIHDNSDWVITFDKYLGPEIFDLPGKEGNIPFLLDYIPSEELSGISSFLTTRPNSEIFGLLGPHFEEFGIPFGPLENNETITMLLEDLRAISSSLVMQLNSGRNKAFEVIGAAFTKRVLEKKKILEEAFLIPVDLHQDLFNGLPSDDKSRADNILVRINPLKRVIEISVVEIKCRRSLTSIERESLKIKMKSQIDNTILALKFHFDPNDNLTYDRLDRQIKNKELKSLLIFYIDRAKRFGLLTENTHQHYSYFLQTLDNGYSLDFKELGIIYDFASPIRHNKEKIDANLTYFTFGGKLISEIIDPESNLNTYRLEKVEEDAEILQALGGKTQLSAFSRKFKMNESASIQLVTSPISNTKTVVETNGIENDESQDLLVPTHGYAHRDDDLAGFELVSQAAEPKIVIEKSNKYHLSPEYDIIIGKSSASPQYGLIGKTIQGKKIALDASETNTISLFGVQGGGKSYTIGTVTEMMLKQYDNVNLLPNPLSGVIFHYSESMDYEPEFTSMIYENDQDRELELLKLNYGASPDKLEDVILLSPTDKLEERKLQYPSIEVHPISFNSSELSVQDWMFLLGAVGNDATYVRQLKLIMRENRNNLTLEGLIQSVNDSLLLSNAQRGLALQRLNFASHYINDNNFLKEKLKPGRLIVVDLRDEFIEKDEALGLFVIMLNIFSGVKEVNGKTFNKFIVFDEAHKYMNNKDLTNSIVTAIREMRHKGVSILIASQDPPSLPNEIIELSSIVLLHKFNSPQWLKHIQKSITPLQSLTPSDLSALAPGEGFLWATKSNDKGITTRPIKITTRPRVTKHGGATVTAI
ncbi:MAG: ATP-binding protein [Pyrinomonadaceae bacterium]|nr:ATP-binding protein [Sphingobacteriaceae bacterium]